MEDFKDAPLYVQQYIHQHGIHSKQFMTTEQYVKATETQHEIIAMASRPSPTECFPSVPIEEGPATMYYDFWSSNVDVIVHHGSRKETNNVEQ